MKQRLRKALVGMMAKRKGRERQQERTPRSWRQVLVVVALACFGVLVTGAVAGVVTLAVFLKDLPSAEDLANFRVAESTRILDRSGQLLYEIHGDQRRTIVPLAAMSRVPDAVVAAEDDSFFTHPGFDVNGLLRASFNCVRGAFRGTGCSGGGSTITQQFVKNTYLSSEKTFSRKAKELFLAMEVEQRFSKEEILGLYLNVSGFGSNAYGIESAARMYFAKPAKDLTLDESALLAGLLQSPSRLSPYGQHLDLLRARQTYVLRRMRELDMIDEGEQKAALAVDTLKKLKPTKESIRAPHFVFYVRDQLEQQYGRELVERGGLTVTTSLDPAIQAVAERKTAELVAKRGKADKVTNSALVTLDPRSGEILAMAGSKDYWATDVDGKVNVMTSLRQPGSAFKPFVYASFFSKGFGPGSVLWDTETDFGGGYVPKNFSGTFSGPVTVRRALGGSLNLPAIKAFYTAGVNDTIDLVGTAFGFDSVERTPRDRIGLSFAIGAVEVTGLEMAQGYAVFATGGSFHRATGVLRVVDSDGNVLEDRATSDAGQQVIDPQVAYEVTSVLSDCGARPAGWGALCYSPRAVVGAKTGTSNRKVGNVYYPSDLWTMTFTPSLVTAMWAGNNDGSVTAIRADGLNTVAPIMRSYLMEVLDLKRMGKEEFPKPAGLTTMALSNSSGLPGGGEGGSHVDIISGFGKEYLSQFRSEPVVSAQVDESCGPALASPFSPPAKVKTWIYSNAHDPLYYVRKDDPLLAAFERAVRGHAALPVGEGSNVVYVGSPNQIPTEVCQRYSSQSAPQVTILSPYDGQLSVGPNVVTVQIVSLNPVTTVTFSYDGATFSTQSACTTCSAPLTLPEGATGQHALRVVVVDELGFTGTLDVPVMVSAARDTTPPDVRLLSPSDGQGVVAGSTISVEARASDSSGVQEVQFAYDRSVFTSVTAAPFTASFTIPAGSEGRHELTAIARDSEGNTGTSSVSIEVTGTPPPGP